MGDKIGEVMDYIQTSYGQPLNLAETAAAFMQYSTESAKGLPFLVSIKIRFPFVSAFFL